MSKEKKTKSVKLYENGRWNITFLRTLSNNRLIEILMNSIPQPRVFSTDDLNYSNGDNDDDYNYSDDTDSDITEEFSDKDEKIKFDGEFLDQNWIKGTSEKDNTDVIKREIKKLEEEIKKYHGSGQLGLVRLQDELESLQDQLNFK